MDAIRAQQPSPGRRAGTNGQSASRHKGRKVSRTGNSERDSTYLSTGSEYTAETSNSADDKTSKRRRSRFSEERRKQVAYIRKFGACSMCKEKKTRCNPDHLSYTVDRYYKDDESPNPLFCPTATSEKLFDTITALEDKVASPMVGPPPPTALQSEHYHYTPSMAQGFEENRSYASSSAFSSAQDAYATMPRNSYDGSYEPDVDDVHSTGWGSERSSRSSQFQSSTNRDLVRDNGYVVPYPPLPSSPADPGDEGNITMHSSFDTVPMLQYAPATRSSNEQQWPFNSQAQTFAQLRGPPTSKSHSYTSAPSLRVITPTLESSTSLTYDANQTATEPHERYYLGSCQPGIPPSQKGLSKIHTDFSQPVFIAEGMSNDGEHMLQTALTDTSSPGNYTGSYLHTSGAYRSTRSEDNLLLVGAQFTQDCSRYRA